MSDTDFIIHILGNLSEEYEVQIESLEARMEDMTDPVTLEDVTAKLNARYERIRNQKEKKDDNKKYVVDKSDDVNRMYVGDEPLSVSSLIRMMVRDYTMVRECNLELNVHEDEDVPTSQ